MTGHLRNCSSGASGLRTGAIRTLALLLTLAILPAAAAGDWPTYRHDIARSGVTSEPLQVPLTPSWTFRARYQPEPAWGDPKPVPIEEILELRRVHFDDVFQVAASEDAVYFGSSANGKLYCLDAGTGKIRWTKTTGGPIRLAPMLVEGRLYVASDDGYAYCLNAQDGAEIWRFRAAPEDRRVLGHGNMISLWPCRTGVLVDNGIAYFGAGIFPAERVFLYAVDARDGRLIWRNDTTGEQPHSRISPQGYLLASPTTLYAPMGRVSPAAFDRRDGRLLYETYFGKNVGGSYALLAGSHVYTGTEQMVAFDQQTKDQFAAFKGRKMVVTDQRFFVADNTHLIAMDRQTKAAVWQTPCACADELILAGDVLIAGGAGQVMAVEAATGKVAWYGPVEGIAKGLAVASGRLLVSTDKGLIYSFAAPGAADQGVLAEPAEESPFANSPHAAMFASAAETILAKTGARRGFCLVLGCETGQLAWELAKRTDLTIYAVSPDAEKVAAARKAIDATGLYGQRVSVEQWSLDGIPYADYFANLVVSETAMLTGQMPADPARWMRMVKPLGGTVMIGQPATRADGVAPVGAPTAQSWLSHASLAGGQLLQENGVWLTSVRGPLAGAGSWTHEYANPGNTACSDDQLVQAPLGVLWFGNPGPGDMPNRHVRAASPLSLDGRLFVQGENVLMAYDIYNGLPLWRREIPGAVRPNASHDGSNLTVCPKGLFVAVGDRCLRLDLATGETLAEYKLPAGTGAAKRWGYVATDGDLLLGTRAGNAGQSEALFALEIDTGKARWTLDNRRISHNTIAFGDSRLYLLSPDVAPEQREQALAERRAAIKELSEPKRAEAEKALANAKVGKVLSLNRSSGQVLWEKPLDVTDCGDTPAAMYHDGTLVLFGVYLDGHYWQQFFAGQFASRSVTILNGEDGRQLWSKPVGYRVRPLIIGDTLHTEPWAYDLKTGDPRKRTHPVTGEDQPWQFARPGHHCGCPSASPHCLFFRSLNLGYYDLDGDFGTMHFSGQRPGCWINFLPVGGLAIMSEASTGCMCAFPNMGTVAFQPVEENKAWAWFSAPGPTTPVQRLALNLGALGDRRDASGQLWLGYPRSGGSLVLPLKCREAFYPTGHFVQENSVYGTTEGTADTWLFTSAAVGLRRLAIPLVEPGDGTALYRVRLAFADAENREPGQRVFDIQLQDQRVAADYDVIRAAGGPGRAVIAEFSGIVVDHELAIELVAKNPKGPLASLPVLHGVEIIRERFTRPGCTPPALVVNDFDRQASGPIRLVNHCDEPFTGTLRIAPRDGFLVVVPSEAVQLAKGQKLDLPVTATAAGAAPGEYEVAITLLRADGTVELERSMRIEHLGNRARLVVPAIEDAHVAQRYPGRNTGTVGVLMVDGGNQQMNDADHSLALLKFNLAIPGKPVSAKLRITNAGNPSGDSGRVCLVDGAWEEAKVTYATRPKIGQELARIGAMTENQTVERLLNFEPPRTGQVSLAIDPTSTDGLDYLSRESGRPGELVIEYEVER